MEYCYICRREVTERNDGWDVQTPLLCEDVDSTSMPAEKAAICETCIKNIGQIAAASFQYLKEMHAGN